MTCARILQLEAARPRADHGTRPAIPPLTSRAETSQTPRSRRVTVRCPEPLNTQRTGHEWLPGVGREGNGRGEGHWGWGPLAGVGDRPLWNQMPVSSPDLRGLRERENWLTRGAPCLLPQHVARGHRSVCLTPDAHREHFRPVLALHASLRRESKHSGKQTGNSHIPAGTGRAPGAVRGRPCPGELPASPPGSAAQVRPAAHWAAPPGSPGTSGWFRTRPPSSWGHRDTRFPVGRPSPFCECDHRAHV